MKKITPQRLKNIALYYLDRFDASSEKLKSVLMRRIQKATLAGDEVPLEAKKWVDEVVVDMQRLGYVNDRRFCENKMHQYLNAGKSNRYIVGKLCEAGIDSDMIQSFLPDDELAQARIFVHKKHLGDDYQKDLAKLARAGFSYDIAQKVLKED